MNRKNTFNENPDNYNKFRPRYSRELFEDIIDFANINESSDILEIGIGTGQATEPFLDVNSNVLSIEIGKDLSNYCKEKFIKYSNFSVLNMPFEDFESEKKFDLVFSATAFHWIKPEVAYYKVKKILEKDGCLAIFWNRPFVNNKDDLLHIEIQKIYKRYMPDSNPPHKAQLLERYENIKQQIFDNNFKIEFFKLYKSIREMNASNYVSLLNTYSDHASMKKEMKDSFMNEIHKTISNNGDSIKINDTIDLYIASPY